MCHCVNPHNKIGEKRGEGRGGRKNEEVTEAAAVADTFFSGAVLFLVSLSSRAVAGSVECIAGADVCIPASWKPIVQPHAKCCSQRGWVLAIRSFN